MPPSDDLDLSHIHAGLRSLATDIDSINLDADNARAHDEASIDAIAASLRQFGQWSPIVVQRQGMIVRIGNGRVLAARRLLWTHVAALVVDVAEVDAVRMALADNRTGELSCWDSAKLGSVLSQVREALAAVPIADAVPGFTEESAAAVLAAAASAQPGQEQVFAPETAPQVAHREVTPEDVAAAGEKLQEKFAASQNLAVVVCPYCAGDFLVDPKALEDDAKRELPETHRHLARESAVGIRQDDAEQSALVHPAPDVGE